MRQYQKIRISEAARSDLKALQEFLHYALSRRGAMLYIDAMMNEVLSIPVYADLYRVSHYADILAIHPQARHMVSHNKKWVYIFHIASDFIILDRILPAKMIKH